MPKDRFHEYLDYCDTVQPIGVGDYIEMVAKGETLAWTKLTRDCLDTYNAGRLRRVVTENGSAAYVRHECDKLIPSDDSSQSNTIPQEGIA